MIFEAKLASFLDEVLLVTAKKTIRIERALKRKNLPLEQIQNRMSLQVTEKEKRSKADFIIENNSTEEKFYDKLEEFYSSLSI